jgi:CheY-like chemotaxis protein
MAQNLFPFAVRLIGFSGPDEAEFDAHFASRTDGYAYFRLDEHNLQDPDVYLADAAQSRALAWLSQLRPSVVRPALLVGSPAVAVPYPRHERPIRWPQLLATLDELMERRADALSRLQASDVVAVPERRRRERPDLDLADPAVYEKMRAKPVREGAVLVVDRNPAFRDYLAQLVERRRVPVAWAGTEQRAADVCRQQPVAMVMINTAAAGVDPYRLCREIKDNQAPERIVVVFLIDDAFVYDAAQASAAGADGYLNKPLAGHHLISVLKKFLPFVR